MTLSQTQVRTTEGVLDNVFDERAAQHEKWGPQHHADGTHSDYEQNANEWKAYNCSRVQHYGDTDWKGILLEEVYEALAETDAEKLRQELVQVAAVAVAWIEDIDSRE